MLNSTCNSTLEELRILPGSENAIAGPLTFHQLALIIGAASSLIAILLSFYLIMMHATHYTVPHEQKHIMRILLMIPVYATSSYLSIRFYWHAIYFQVICDCYEAFAISSFFSLLCHYIKPDLHEQKEYFRNMHPITPWVWPLNWFAKCCGGERGPWRTPRSGLTWFNIIWIGIYHYCFIRIAMTISAVASQYFHKYCESSNSPVFSHIWIVVIQSIAVTIAMYCVIQFYVQLRNTEQLKPNQPFLKVLAIKLVIFLSFWQSAAISVGTSTLNLVHPNEVLAYPDIKVGIPSLLLCFEMACFAVLHLWAFPYRGYIRKGTPKQGGFLGIKALWDTVNIWDVAKGFGRGMRWLFVGAKHRHHDVSYQLPRKNSAVDGGAVGMDDLSSLSDKQGNHHGDHLDAVETGYGGGGAGRAGLGMMSPMAANSTAHLPIANEFRASKFGSGDSSDDLGVVQQRPGGGGRRQSREERAALIQNAQPNPTHSNFSRPDPSPLSPDYRQQQDQQQRYDSPPSSSDDYVVVDVADAGRHQPEPQSNQDLRDRHQSLSTVDEESSLGGWSRQGSRQDMHFAQPVPQAYQKQPQQPQQQQQQQPNNNPRNSTQLRVGEALWGPRDPQGGPR